MEAVVIRASCQNLGRHCATRCHWCFVSCLSGSAEQGSFGVQQETAAMGASLAVRFWETLVVGHATVAGRLVADGDLHS